MCIYVPLSGVQQDGPTDTHRWHMTYIVGGRRGGIQILSHYFGTFCRSLKGPKIEIFVAELFYTIQACMVR